MILYTNCMEIRKHDSLQSALPIHAHCPMTSYADLIGSGKKIAVIPKKTE